MPVPLKPSTPSSSQVFSDVVTCLSPSVTDHPSSRSAIDWLPENVGSGSPAPAGSAPITNCASCGASASGTATVPFAGATPASGWIVPVVASHTCTGPVPTSVAVRNWA